MLHEQADPVGDAFVSVLEQLAFMFAEPAARDELPASLSDAVRVHMTFDGAATGGLTVLTSRDACGELLANVTGDDAETDGLDVDAGREALKEMANVLCGQLLTAVAGKEPVFDLSSPACEDAPSDTWAEAIADEAAAGFLVDDHPFLVRFDYPSAA